MKALTYICNIKLKQIILSLKTNLFMKTKNFMSALSAEELREVNGGCQYCVMTIYDPTNMPNFPDACPNYKKERQQSSIRSVLFPDIL